MIGIQPVKERAMGELIEREGRKEGSNVHLPSIANVDFIVQYSI